MLLHYLRDLSRPAFLLCVSLLVAVRPDLAPREASAKVATLHCQGQWRTQCDKGSCRTVADPAVSITLNPNARTVELCLYSQCLAGSTTSLSSPTGGARRLWSRVTSKPGYPSPLTMIVFLQLDRRRERFLLVRPGGTVHHGRCRPAAG